MKNREYSGLKDLPNGRASDRVTEGCIVLEGGAFRGMYSEGVLDALMESDINLRCTIGCSAGALNGLNYVSGQIGRTARINFNYRFDSRYVGAAALRRSGGIIGFDFMYGELQALDPLDIERFLRPERRFVAVATECATGQTRYFDKADCSDILQAVRASASMPYVSRPVMLDEKGYLDGGCSCKIPYEWALREGYRKIIVVKTYQDSFRRSISEKSSRLARMVYRSTPAFAEALAHSDENYNRQCDDIARLQAQGQLYVISPSAPVTVSRLEKDLEKLGALYRMGYRDAMDQMAQIRKYLEAE